MSLYKKPLTDLLTRLRAFPTGADPKVQLNAALGCKTTEVAFSLLGHVAQLEAGVATASPEQLEKNSMTAIATLAELEPQSATEALLATQMIGAQRLSMLFLNRAAQAQDSEVVDACILRASRLMRVFTEQLEAMAKLKGKSGQQRVVVEHVSVNDGGQAIVGTVSATKVVTPGGGRG